jgi:Uma2 family endonuclease
MSTATRVSLEEYLATSYRPDRDYLDGEVVERNVGEFEHSDLQGELVHLFRKNGERWAVRALPEQRVRVAAKRYRIPDISVIERGVPKEAVLTSPPLICIEVLSKDDSLNSMQERIDDYVAFGVPNIWVLDPVAQRAWTCKGNALHPVSDGALHVEGTPIEIQLAELFAELA